MTGKMPRPDAQSKQAFTEIVGKRAEVTVRPMFGNVAAFVNGNMFAGLFGSDMFVRLADADREQLMGKGGAEFAPMPGRAMKDYAVLPAGWARRSADTRKWFERSLAWASGLPAKQPGGKKRK
jgi:TfoX/Sxy family transcriptional regulator of competence genes